MTANKRYFPVGLFKLLDIVSVVVAFGVATALLAGARSRVSFASILSMETTISKCAIFALVVLACHLIFLACGLYRPHQLPAVLGTIADILKATVLAAGCFVAIVELLQIKHIGFSFLLIFSVTALTAMCTSRGVFRFLHALSRAHSGGLRQLLIVGTNPRAVAFARKISANPEFNYRLLGFVDDEWPGIEEFHESGFHIVSDSAGLAQYLRKQLVDEVVIYLPFGSFYNQWLWIADLCTHHGITVRLNSDMFGINNACWHEEDDGSKSIAMPVGVQDRWALAVKRVLDIVASSILLIFLMPLFVVTAVAIKLTSRGPVFFKQDRVGLHRRRFKVYKFRTMVPDAEKLMAGLESKNELTGPVFKIKNDPRITKIGKFLRRSSIDELPQLLNVLKGDMSLVGPRPLAVRDYEGFNDDWARRRFSVKPGITCLWQVNGRNSIAFEQWMRLDLQYMDQWSLWLDLKILARTVPAVMRGSGAA